MVIPPQDALGSTGRPAWSVDDDLLEHLRAHYRSGTLERETRKNFLNTLVLVHERLARDVDWDSLRPSPLKGDGTGDAGSLA